MVPPRSRAWVSLPGHFFTVVGGYGMKDGGPEPLFFQAFFKYYGPAMFVTVIELVRLTGSRRL